MRKGFLAAMLCVAILLSAANAAAVPREQARRRRMNDITWSGERLWQVLANEKLLDFRIYADGEKQLFKLNFGPTDTGAGVMMTLSIVAGREPMQFMYTAEALDFLESIGVTQVRGQSGESQIIHEIDQLRAMLAGEDLPALAPDLAAGKNGAAKESPPSAIGDLPVQSDPSLQGEDPTLP